MKRILTIGCRIPGGYGEQVGFYSKASLLDADLVLVHPMLPYDRTGDRDGVSAAVEHWKSELAAALQADITVIVMLANAQTDTVGQGVPRRILNSYEILPIAFNLVTSTGSSMLLTDAAMFLHEYWRQFEDESKYQAYILAWPDSTGLITTRNGGRLLGAMSRISGSGTLVALPPVALSRYDLKPLNEPDDGPPTWGDDAIKWGRRFTLALESIDEGLKGNREASPPPEWVSADRFTINKEIELADETTRLQAELEIVNQRVTEVGRLKALLFANGHTLEDAVLEAAKFMGFDVSKFHDGNSEFDGILECPEGRCLIEVEGKDNRAINIEKMRQLNTNIYEDLERDEVDAPAKPVLFGNAHRLKLPTERPEEYFTAKCVLTAKAHNTALIRTCDLFEIARALANNPSEEYAAACRKAILNTVGLVTFPSVPQLQRGEAL